MPTDGPPTQLINEIHSFGQVFTGCFYACVRGVFNSAASHGEADLLSAARTVAALLVAAARSAPLVPRFFQSVGRAMVLADQQLNAGANRDIIRRAFEGHGIALGSNAMLAPHAALEGPGPAFGKGPKATLAMVTKKDLMRRIGASPKNRLEIAGLRLFDQPVAMAVHKREVPLGSVTKKLAGVVAMADEAVMVGSSGKRAMIMGPLPEEFTTQDEVLSFVRSLVDHDRISFGKPSKRAVAASAEGFPTTHQVRVAKGKKVLTRVRFLYF